MQGAMDQLIPYSVEFGQESSSGRINFKGFQAKTEDGGYEMRLNSTVNLPGRKYEVDAWQNQAGIWQQYGEQVLRLDTAPRSKESPLMAFVALRTEDSYSDVKLEKEVLVSGQPCYVVRGRLLPGVDPADNNPHRRVPVEEVYTISKNGWMPRAIEAYDAKGSKITAITYTNIQGNLILEPGYMAPAQTNVAVVQTDEEMVKYVQAFNHAFVPAIREQLAVRARAGRKASYVLVGFVALTGLLIAFNQRRASARLVLAHNLGK